MSVTELLGAILSALAVWLTARRNMACWPISLAAAGLYCWVFVREHLYADAALQFGFCLYVVYGWQHWQRLTKPDGRIVVRRPAAGTLFRGVLYATAGSALWGAILARFTNDPNPLLDATLTAFSILAQSWDTMRFRETWALWIVVDSIYVALFVSRGLYPTAVLYAGFVGLAINGYRLWRPAPSFPPNSDMPDTFTPSK